MWKKATVFTTLLFVAELILFRASYYDQNRDQGYLDLLVTYEPLHIALHVFAIAVSSALTAAFVCCALASRWRVRVAYLTVFTAATALEYSFQSTFDRFSDVTNVEPFLLITNLETQLDALALYFSWTAVLPSLTFALLLLISKPSRPGLGWKTLPLVLAVTLGFYVAIARYKVLYAHGLKYPVISAQAMARTTGDYLASITFLPEIERDVVAPVARASGAYRNVVFIVDESIRGDHLSLNGYERDTTPFLKELARQGLLLNWGTAAAGSTCSGSSNTLLMTGVPLAALPDGDHQLQRAPTIFQYAKALGYKTYYLDAQMNVVWNLTKPDLEFVDEWWNANRFLSDSEDLAQVDFALADTIRSLVQGSNRNFIWVTKEGAHVPYFRRVPSSEAIWMPQWTNGSWDAGREDEIINSYDNALRYNLEGFFRRLFPGSDVPKDTIFVYTADHGESLAERGEAVAHCGLGRQEAIVPLVMFGHHGPAVDTTYRASHQNLFPTLLDLMGVPESSRTRAYERSLLRATAADSQPRFFFGVDLGQRHPKIRFD